jgi:hypothetical protein
MFAKGDSPQEIEDGFKSLFKAARHALYLSR